MSRSRRFCLTEDEILQILMCDDSGGESENELDGEDEAFIEEDTNSNVNEIKIYDPGALINDDIEEQPPKRTKLQLDNFTWQKSHNPAVLLEHLMDQMKTTYPCEWRSRKKNYLIGCFLI